MNMVEEWLEVKPLDRELGAETDSIPGKRSGELVGW
jgi:hypothetical protein